VVKSLKEQEEIRRKALEVFLSGRQVSGRGTEVGQKQLTEEEIEALEVPITTKDLRIRGRKKGKRTPRQTFRLDEVLWRQFVKKARKRGKTASQVLREFIFRYVKG